ncbi:MAG: hypothetical protein Q4C29_00310 [bacterium]|nr:hypothetical protein [bacterium]
MKKFFAEFLVVFAECILVICLAFVSFVFVLNIYHYDYISYVYNINPSESKAYKDFKSDIKSLSKKYKKVNSSLSASSSVIYSDLDSCFNIIEKGYYYNDLSKKTTLESRDIYKSNNDIVNDINSKCLFRISYDISSFEKDGTFKHPFNDINDGISDKRDILISNAEFLLKLEYSNSSYSFSTQDFKYGIFNRTSNELFLTYNNYKILTSILDDIVDWYVLEFGGSV